MGRKDAITSGLQAFKRRVNKDFPLKKMIFFGSRATGKEHEDSDIDLIIVSDKFKSLNFIKRAAKMYNYWDMDYPVDFLCFTPEEFEKKTRGVSIVSEAVKEGIEIT